MGLHGVLGCEHGSCASDCCRAEASCCKDCVFCERGAKKTAPVASEKAAGFAFQSVVCDDWALCDLLAQYHSASVVAPHSSSLELASGKASLHRKNALVAAAIRLAPSRGPPAV